MQTLSSFVAAYALNALWQLPLLVLAAAATVRLFAGMRAKVIHRVWLGCLLLSLTLPGLSLLRDQAQPLRGLSTSPQAAMPLAAQAPNVQHNSHGAMPPLLSYLWSERPAWNSEHLFPPPAIFSKTICLLYIASVLFAFVRLAWGLWLTRGLLKTAKTAVLPPELQKHWNSCMAIFGQERIELLSSSKLSSPATLNWPRPIVILPVNLHDAEASEVAAAFCHELAHIQRRDFLCNLLYESLGTLLFFHPALHWIRRRIQETRELACDDLAADAMAGRHAYAHSLLQLTQKMRTAADIPQPSCALGIFEGEFMEKRIMNLIEKKTKQTRLRLCMSMALGSCLVLLSCAVAVAFGLSPLLAHASTQADQAPSGWFLAGSKPANYRTGIDSAVIHDGQPSAYLQSQAPTTDGFGTLMQTISAANYAGKRVRLRATVKSQDVGEWAGMWMRVDKEQTMVAFDNMQDRAIKGTQPWTTFDVVLDVPQDATSISFGTLLSGSGKVWVNHVTFEAVGQETETTGAKPSKKAPLSTSPVNLDFKE